MKLGRGRHAPPIEVRVEMKTTRDEATGCWLYNGQRNFNPKDPRRGGYGVTTRVVDGVCRQIYVHRWSYETHVGAIPEGLCVMHTCDTRNCWNPAHLTLGTARDNTRDMMDKGRHGRLRVTVELAEKIRAEYRPYDPECGAAALGAKYGLHPNYVARVASGSAGPPSRDARGEVLTTEQRAEGIRARRDDSLRRLRTRLCVVCGREYEHYAQRPPRRACSRGCGQRLNGMVLRGELPSMRATLRERTQERAS